MIELSETYTCPVCARTSHDSIDANNGYCGACHGYTSEDPPPGMRWVLFLATPPIAIIANAGRVTVTGLLSEVNPELAHGVFHTMEGWVIFTMAGVMLAALHLCINWRTRKPGATA